MKVYSNHFQRVLYSHVKRNDNSVAHSLAKHAISILNLQVWMEDVPSHIGFFFVFGCNSFSLIKVLEFFLRKKKKKVDKVLDKKVHSRFLI